MIDRQLFLLVPGNITGLLQRLNGAPMYDILDTFDALLKEKNFYPNVGQYRSELDAAGIFVQRMEVAMSAVMAKNGNQSTFTDFASSNAAKLAQLPEDQRGNIEKYFTGFSSASALPKDKLVAQYLEWAKNAVYKTRSLLDRGAPNRLSDWPSGAPIMALPGYERSASSDPEKIAKVAIENRGGNCEEFSATAFVQLKKMGARPIHWVKLVPPGDHAFVLIGDGPVGMLDDKDLKKWGDSVVVCDAWDKVYYIASEIPSKLPSYKDSFKAMVNAMVGY
jgi:hypothetical protein